MRQIAIIGMGGSEFHAPWRDPNWAVWALPWHSYAYHAARLFEMHPLDLVVKKDAGRGGKAYWDKLCELSDCGIPIFMQAHTKDLPSSVEYPLDDVISTVGRDYFGSSPAYPIALAIHEAAHSAVPTRIGIWGVDLKEDIYDHQRPNLEWLLGFAEGRGIEIQTHPDSNFFSLKKDDHIGNLKVTYPVRYGWV